MRLEWLEDILAVAELGSFSEAAKRRKLTQSAFSRRIQNIEEFVGIDLFDRSRKPVQLRPTVDDHRLRIAELVKELHLLTDDLRRGDRKSTNRIVLASQHALTTSLTPRLINLLQTENSDLHIRLRSANLDDCFALLLSRQADLALVYRAMDDDQPLEAAYIETLMIGHDRLIPVYAAGRKEALALRMAGGDLPYVAYPGEVFLGQIMARKLLPTLPDHLRATPKVETALTLAALELATAGIGVAWVPSSLAASAMSDRRLVDLSDELPAFDLLMTAVRLAGTVGEVEALVWDRLRMLAARALRAEPSSRERSPTVLLG
ncbi:MAG: LysR family transcriptional regulator [Tabrizicola sp.]|nr:LysR family transcriptional regulator [Tabrizicola sp.]